VLETTKAVTTFLSEHGAPFHAMDDDTASGCLAASRDALSAWLQPLH